MKRTFLGAVLLALCFMFVTSTATATSTCQSLVVKDVNAGNGGTIPEGGATADASGFTTSIDCTVGSLEFKNFAYVANTPGTLQPLDLSGCVGGVGCAIPGSGNQFGIILNPNLSSPPTADVSFIFEVISSTPITSVTLVNNGSPIATVQEKVCDSAGLANGPGVLGELQGSCVDSPIANFSGAASSGSQTVTLTHPSNTIFIWKDINVQNGGALSNFQQSFTINTAPEPATMALAGVALLGLGLIRRRKQA